MTLYELKTKIRRWKWIDRLATYLEKTALFSLLYRVLRFCKLDDYSRQQAGRKTNEKCTSYFTQHQAQVDQILQALADEKSKNVFRQQISFRQYGKPFPFGTPHDQYFPKDIIHLAKEEVFIDCGAFTGDSIVRFQKTCKNTYKKIVAFEASAETFTKLEACHFKKCLCYNLGVWNQPDTLSFLAQAKEDDKIACTVVSGPFEQREEAPTITIKANALDNLPECSDMTFLKMDIEGAELNALKGAEKTIRKNHPTLAISIYHADKDLLDIPLWIMSLGIDYTYYVRHHAYAAIDVVFYAVPKQKTASRR